MSSAANQRLALYLSHLNAGSSGSASSLSSHGVAASSANSNGDPVINGLVRNRQPLVPQAVRWNGWGFKDTEFSLDGQGQVCLLGDRYLFSGKSLPSLRTWMEARTGIDINFKTPSQPLQDALNKLSPPVWNEDFLSQLSGHYHRIDFSPEERLFHAHGHTAQEIYELRFGEFKRVPDVVIYPGSHEHVEFLVKLAVAHNVVLIPYGGGTSVSQALMCPTNENRMIVSIDMHEMKQIKWINKNNRTACIQAGAVGRDIDRQLKGTGFVLGHEPDSTEFSTLGGWIATRASGMRKNKYGNIEDIVVSIKIVTPLGTVEKSVQVPRISTGPDIHQFILGSEGTLGIVTEAVLRLREAPELTVYGSMIFPNFELGVQCLHEIQNLQAAPVSIRLVDSNQFQFGQALKPGSHDWKENVKSKLQKWYVTQHLKFDPEKMVAATLLFEGSKASIAQQEKIVYATAAKYGGMKAGPENGIRGYFLTYMIAYLRDFGINYCFMGESFETSVPWENIIPLCQGAKQAIAMKCKQLGIQHEPFVSCRVTQLYDTGVCVYFYFGFVWKGLKDPVAAFDAIEHAARDEILRHGGSLSHHHGVGKIRKYWLEQTISSGGMSMIKAVKQGVDKKNIFAAGNLIDV